MNEKRIKLTKKKEKNYNKKVLIILILVLLVSFKMLLPNYLNINQILNLFSFNFIKYKSSPTVSICLCVIAKMENLYAKEYVNHYKN